MTLPTTHPPGSEPEEHSSARGGHAAPIQAEFRRIMTTLEYRLDYQRLVSEISTRFVHLESAALDAAIDDTLARLGAFTAADRCYLFLFSDDGQWMSNTHEWRREGVSRESHGLQDIPLPVALPYFSQKMAGWEVFHVPRVEQLGPEASEEKKLFQSQKIQSLLVVPMVMEDRLIGCLGLDAVMKPADWPPDTTALLRLVGEVFVNALIRKRNEDALRLSEQRFRDVLRNIPDLYFRTDMDGRLVLTNNEGARLLGHDSVDQVLGLNVVQEFQHDPRARERMLEILIREGRLRHFEIQLENRLGQKLDVEIHCHLVRDENGKAVAIEGLGRDITLRKQAERELQESQARFRDLVERLPDVFYQIRVFRPDLTPEERDQVDRGIRDLKESDSGRIDSVLDRLVDELGPFLDMTITYANQTAGQVLGYPLDQVGSVTLALVLDPKEMARAERDTLRIFHRQRLYGLDFELLGSRGDRIPLQVNAYLSSNEFPYLVNGVGRDVTELTRAQRELREAKEYNDSILRSMRDSLLVLDPLLRVHMANKATRDILGYEKGDLLGRPFRDIALGGRDFEKSLLDRIMIHKQIEDFDVVYLARSGERIPVRLAASLIEIELDGQTQPIGITCVAHDMRKIKELQDQLVRSEKMATIGVLAAGIAHEIKNPLAIILQGTEFLGYFSENKNDPVMSDSLARIRRAVLRADKIVKDLLAFSRMETDQFDPQPLDEILDEALALVGGQTELKRIEVIRQYAPNPPPVRIDRNQILQVFINLLLNAVEAMPEGGVLRLGLFQGRGLAGHPYLEITVEDTGPGIPDPLRGKIFDPFFTTKKHSGNTGLGLFVARGIVEKYKGQITVFSREGEGANITILLPCREEDLPKPQGR